MEPNVCNGSVLKTAAILVATLSLAVTLAGSTDGHHRRPTPTMSCTELTQLVLPETVITSAAVMPAQGAMPAYCKVLATVAPETDIELRLPSAWHRRLLHLGGAGFDGTIPNLDLNAAELQRGYAVTGSNGGHRDPTGGPTRLLNNPTLIQDYAHTAIEKTVHFAKAIVRAHYGHPAVYSYFSGCSNGGRGAFNAAAKYSDEYDGVIAGAPARNTAGLISSWVRAGLLEPPAAAKLAAMYRAELAQCDADDGLADGIISNPARCRFDPATVRCPAGVDSSSCLTDRELQAVNTIRSDLELANGRTIYSRLGVGNPAKGFGVFMPLGPPGSPTIASFGAAFLQYIVYSDPAYNPASYDVNRDLRTVVAVLERVYDFSANTAPLARYLRSGKKMIVWHGTEDTGLSHLDTIRTYDMMAEAAGEGAENARLYTPPGVMHCGGGPGADRFDMIGAITDWVENGDAPRTLSAAKIDAGGNVLFTRPLCEYPKYPRYNGYGDPNDAASFRCVRPKDIHRNPHDDDRN
jgi:tannase/feruloyl esterase